LNWFPSSSDSPRIDETFIRIEAMPPDLGERLLSVGITLLVVITLILLIRAVLGVKTTHEKLDTILRQLRDMKSANPGATDPPPREPGGTAPHEGEKLDS
jgi:hypothetical protein